MVGVNGIQDQGEEILEDGEVLCFGVFNGWMRVFKGNILPELLPEAMQFLDFMGHLSFVPSPCLVTFLSLLEELVRVPHCPLG